MRYLVTGGAGFIGSAIANRLLNEGNEVYVIDNLQTGHLSNIPKNTVFINEDFSKNETIEKLQNAKFDVIFHIGGQSSGEISFEDPEYDLNTNTLSTLKLLQYCVKTGCKKFVYASTMSVYGEQSNKEQFSEDDVENPKSFYAVGKLASEKYMKIFAQQYDIEYVALRYFNVYGPGQNLENLKQGMVSIYLKQFLDDSFEKVLVKGDLNRFRDLIYIDDVVDITIESSRNDKFKNKILNIGTGKKTTVKQILTLIKDNLQSTKDIVISKGTPGDQFGIYANNQLLLSIYDKPLTSFEQGLKKMIEWVKEN
ncbi:NAD-dependent epimerase/dehydratase family protein [Sulfurimonas hydrogeniphila]|uniref:NAD-dependent epimerase/dehydratase family protein n=1 Tax=Sulfurimonas hydrogeniphila TaxID=2509341 RepID=UPI00125EC192|nr:NAD-dependent epimerase/dehydratase family protein [Sulfurimonas hydrogeniphila]